MQTVVKSTNHLGIRGETCNQKGYIPAWK